MLATTRTFSLLGISAQEVTAEVDVRRGLASFTIVGLPDAAVREARERVRAAIVNSNFDFPLQRITVNLAPASLRKVGPSFDLAIAAGILVASGQISGDRLGDCALAGELALDGNIRPVAGTLPMAEQARRLELAKLAVPYANATEASIAAALGLDGPDVVPLRHLGELVTIGTEDEPDAGARHSGSISPSAKPGPDLADLRGQPALRRAIEVSAAGGHGLLMIGPPGSGKSMAARRLPSIMPPLAPEECLEVMRIASACAMPLNGAPLRPFRAPHHTVSASGLVGGGSPPCPGEVTLSHRGILFLDELCEFDRRALEALRQPLEEGRVSLVRAGYRLDLPCQFTLVAAANPCPCGRGERDGECSCDPAAVRRYESKLSGALADRIDIAVGIEQPPAKALHAGIEEPSSAVRERVRAARLRQAERLGRGRANGEMRADETRRVCALSDEAATLLAAGHGRYRLSGRGYDRVLRVSRTIADLAGEELIGEPHVGEALALRRRQEQV